ncbi:hypothetical protein ABH945_002005 [Paraburkholderia sp. GAS333]
MPRISEGGFDGTGDAKIGEVKKSPREAGLVKHVAGLAGLFFL